MLQLQSPTLGSRLGTNKAAVRGIAEVGDVVHFGVPGCQCAAQQLFEAGPVHARAEPIGAHVACRRGVVLARVLHREQFGEFPPIAGDQPIFVVGDRAARRIVLLNEVGDDFHDQVMRQSVQMQLHRMGDLEAAPVVVELDLELPRTSRRQSCANRSCDARIFREGDMRAQIEQKSVSVPKRRRMAAEIGRLVVNDWPDTLRRSTDVRHQSRPCRFQEQQCFSLIVPS